MRIVALLVLALLMACGEEHTEVLTIGPYTKRCFGPFEQDCYMEYNEEVGRWHFFYDGIQGFVFEPGYIYTLEVRIMIVDKVKASDDFDYAKNEKP